MWQDENKYGYQVMNIWDISQIVHMYSIWLHECKFEVSITNVIEVTGRNVAKTE